MIFCFVLNISPNPTKKINKKKINKKNKNNTHINHKSNKLDDCLTTLQHKNKSYVDGKVVPRRPFRPSPRSSLTVTVLMSFHTFNVLRYSLLLAKRNKSGFYYTHLVVTLTGLTHESYFTLIFVGRSNISLFYDGFMYRNI